MIRVRVRVKVWFSVKYYAIKVVPESFRIHEQEKSSSSWLSRIFNDEMNDL
jgi:hypothetical protein